MISHYYRENSLFSKVLPYGLLIGYAIITLSFLKTYLIWQSLNMILGLAGLSLMWDCKYEKKGGNRFGYLALAALVLTLFLPVKTMLFFSVAIAMFYVVETLLGKVNAAMLSVVLMISPVAQYAMNVFSFPVRLFISETAGKAFGLAGMPVKVMGNTIAVNGNDFMVDSACMGVNMTVASILLSIIMVGVLTKKSNKVLPVFFLGVGVAAAFLCNLVSNLFRVILLVNFTVLPSSIFHEVIGLICFIIYVCVPAFYMSRFMVAKFGRSPGSASAVTGNNGKAFRTIVIHLLLLVCVVISAFNVQRSDRLHYFDLSNVHKVSGYKVSSVNDDVLKLSSGNSLVYVKPIDHFFNAEHNPLICWNGSGFTQKNISEAIIDDRKVCVAVLKRENEILYTAWWFDNGETQTTSQLEWRWKMMRGNDRFSLINITAATPEKLNAQIRDFMQKQLNRKILYLLAGTGVAH